MTEIETLYPFYAESQIKKNLNLPMTDEEREKTELFMSTYENEIFIEAHKRYNDQTGVLLAVSLTNSLHFVKPATEADVAEQTAPKYCALCKRTVWKNKIVKGSEMFILDDKTAFWTCSAHAKRIRNVFDISHFFTMFERAISNSLSGVSSREEALHSKYANTSMLEWKLSKQATPTVHQVVNYLNILKKFIQAFKEPEKEEEVEAEVPQNTN